MGVDRPHWSAKLPAIFFDVAEVLRSFELDRERLQLSEDGWQRTVGRDATPAARHARSAEFILALQHLMSRVTAAIAAIDQRHGAVPFNTAAYSYLYPDPVGPAANAPKMSLLLHWWRHSEAYEQAARLDQQKDYEAWKRIVRTETDRRDLDYRGVRIKPFKVDMVHRELLELILCYELTPLTADERAACFDEYCACGKGHDDDALKKQDGRLRADLGIKTPKSRGSGSESRG